MPEVWEFGKKKNKKGGLDWTPFDPSYSKPPLKHTSLCLYMNLKGLEESSSSQQWWLELDFLHHHPLYLFFSFLLLPFPLLLLLLLFLFCCSSLSKVIENVAKEGSSLLFVRHVDTCGRRPREGAASWDRPSCLLLCYSSNKKDHVWGGKPSSPSFQT